MTKPHAPNQNALTFVTGANDKYFFMCGILLESLQSCFPDVPCLVMDLGLSDAPRKYFEEKKLLLKLPAGLNKTDHPYRLKSSMASFLGDARSPMPIWIDCDIIAIRAASQQLSDLARELVSHNKDMALATDEGPNQSLSAIGSSFGETKLLAAIADDPSLKERRCLNAGLVVFSNPGAAGGWQTVAAAQDGDKFPDQNALNLMAYRDLDRITILDSCVWNVHARLLKAVQATDNGVTCDGQKPIFVHATSAYEGDLLGGTMPISAKDCGCEAYLRFFTNEHLRKLQEDYLSGFLRNNFETLRNLGVLINISNARRNDPCPCRSGKKFKHCHGASA
jgi:hypothetical protein